MTSNPFTRGWLGTQEREQEHLLFGAKNVVVYDESDTRDILADRSKRAIELNRSDVMSKNFANGRSSYQALTRWNQDANNCAGHSAARAVEAYMMFQAFHATDDEMSAFEVDVPWVWGVGKNEAGQTGPGGATIGAMLGMIANNGVLPYDTPSLAPYSGRSNVWCRRYGKQSKTAPYAKYWDIAAQYVVHVGRLRVKDTDAWYDAAKAGIGISYGTSQGLKLSGNEFILRGGWMHAMAAYGYNKDLDAVGNDNSHGDGFGWMRRNVIDAITHGRYYDAFVVLGMEPRKLQKPIFNLINAS